MQQFSEVYLAVMASILTVIASVFTFSKWTRQIFLKRFSAKPRDKIVKTNFTYLDVQSGVKVLLEYCDDMNIDMIIGINRGGAIIGGILGKHLKLFCNVIEVVDGRPIEFKLDIIGQSVLIVDDRISTGQNMQRVEQHFITNGTDKVRTAVFAFLPNNQNKIVPDKFVYKVSSRRTVRFPWEIGVDEYQYGKLLASD